MEERLFEEKPLEEMSENTARKISHMKSIFDSSNLTPKQRERINERFRKNGYKYHTGKFYEMWVADPRTI